MSFSGNPATQIWQRVMESIHQDLERKEFNISYGGGATGIFGSQEELEEQSLSEEEREEKKRQEEEEEKRKQEEEEKKNQDQEQEQSQRGGLLDFITRN